MFVRRVDKLQIQHPVIQVLFEERNIHEQSLQQSVGGGAGKTGCGICKRALNSSRSSAKMCLETSLVEFQGWIFVMRTCMDCWTLNFEGIGCTWANCDVNLARLRFWCPSFQIIIALSNRRQFVVRSGFFYWAHSYNGAPHLFLFITGLGWCITSLRCPQGRHVASDGSPHINSVQFANNVQKRFNGLSEFFFYPTSTAFPCCYAQTRKWWEKKKENSLRTSTEGFCKLSPLLRFHLQGRRQTPCSSNGLSFHVHTIELNGDDVGSQQSSLSEGANLFSWFRPPDISFLFLSALQRWWYQIWHALLCFLRCSQSCSGWCICICCARLRCRKWSSSLWAFIIYTTWPTFRRPDGRETASVSARAFLPVAAFAERCLLKAKF